MNPCQAHDFENNETMNTSIGIGLTGKFTFKQNFWGSLILWVEYSPGLGIIKWRKADHDDLPYLNFKK